MKEKAMRKIRNLATASAGKFVNVVAGLLFMFLCMLLPLVGPAGSETPFTRKNYAAFLAVLLAVLIVSALATWVNSCNRKDIGVGQIYFPLALTSLSVLIIIAFMFGLLKI